MPTTLLRVNWLDTLDRVGKLVARCWLDETVRQSVLNDPKNTLKQAGIEAADWLEIKVNPLAYRWKIEPSSDNAKVACFHLPLAPRPDHLSDADLEEFLAETANIEGLQKLEETQLLKVNWPETMDRVGKLIARSWLDEEFRQKFIADPVATLEETGLQVPHWWQVKVDPQAFSWKVEQSSEDPTKALFQIPLMPRPSYVSDEELRQFVEQESGQAVQCGF